MKLSSTRIAPPALQCPVCETRYDINARQSFATCCNQPLVTIFSNNDFSIDKIITKRDNMWRYAAVLPLFHERNIISLGEGWTKIVSLNKLGIKNNIQNLLLKDESTNPTGSFKARGISMAISKAKELNIQHCIIPTAGNAGGALAAYCARADIKATVVMPRHTTETLKEECRLFGAELILVDGLIDSCGKLAKQMAEDNGYFDMSTMKEPYRLEGKKTIGYEIAEQLNWQLPDVIIYPTGGGTGLIGMWKAFEELIEAGLIYGKLPRMVIVQSENCAPMMEICKRGEITNAYNPVPSLAYGLAVPYPFAKDMMMRVVNDSNGTVVTVTEEQMLQGVHEVASEEGIMLSPEGSATYKAMQKLHHSRWIKEEETVLLFNTGSWYKYR